MDGYIICTTPRSGSTLLCDLLARVPGAGAPDSFFMADPDPVWAQAWGMPSHAGLSPEAHAAASLRAAGVAGRAGATGLFGLRLMRDDLPGLMALIDLAHPSQPDDRARLRVAFGEVLCLHLTRGDKLAQAVSLVKAEQTGLWHIAPDGSEVERLSPPQPPVYDRARIAETLAGLERLDAAWQAWFQAEQITPLRVDYDALAEAPGLVLGEICGRLGLAAQGQVQPGVARLADAVSADWMWRYRSGD
jgi:LPS sulfotransferase NodH